MAKKKKTVEKSEGAEKPEATQAETAPADNPTPEVAPTGTAAADGVGEVPPATGDASVIETPTDLGTDAADSATTEPTIEPTAEPTTEPPPPEGSDVPTVDVDVEPITPPAGYMDAVAVHAAVGTAAELRAAGRVRPGEVSIDVVLADIADSMSDSPAGYKHLSPDPQLSPDEAETQLRLYISLAKHGVPLRDQAGVYPWLLRQVARSLRD